MIVKNALKKELNNVEITDNVNNKGKCKTKWIGKLSILTPAQLAPEAAVETDIKEIKEIKEGAIAITRLGAAVGPAQGTSPLLKAKMHPNLNWCRRVAKGSIRINKINNKRIRRNNIRVKLNSISSTTTATAILTSTTTATGIITISPVVKERPTVITMVEVVTLQILSPKVNNTLSSRCICLAARSLPANTTANELGYINFSSIH